MKREPVNGPQAVAPDAARAALSSVNVVAGHSLVRRAQRRVQARCDQIDERHRQVRQRIGLALLATSAILLLLTPAIWGGYSQSAGWRHFADADFQVMYWTAWLLPITLITLVVGFLRVRTQRPERKRLHLVR
jgi:hypothetical protein